MTEPNFVNDPKASDIEDMRNQFGMVDPMAEDFTLPRNTNAERFLKFALFVGIPLAAYHFSLTVRGWTDDGIAWLAKEYEQRFPREQTLKLGMRGYVAPKDGAMPKRAQISVFPTAKAEEGKLDTNSEMQLHLHSAVRQDRCESTSCSQANSNRHNRATDFATRSSLLRSSS